MPIRMERVSLTGRPAYFWFPEGAGSPLPAVVVIHAALGLDDYVQNLSQRVASAGYATLAPDLYDEGNGRPAALSAERIREAAAVVHELGLSAQMDMSLLAAKIAALPGPANVQVPETLARMRSISEAEAQERHVETLRGAVFYA